MQAESRDETLNLLITTPGALNQLRTAKNSRNYIYTRALYFPSARTLRADLILQRAA
jgi:hypothetical protein